MLRRLFTKQRQFSKCKWMAYNHNPHHRLERRTIASDRLNIERTSETTSFNNRPAKEDLEFGKVMSDHMLTMTWDVENEWGEPKIVPYQDLRVSPAACGLHYGIQCFEGLKAYKSLSDESLLLFRPDMNAKRLAASMERLQMPGADFDQGEFVKCIAELVKVDSRWVPTGEGYSLYIRPFVVGTEQFLGVSAPTSLLLGIITSPVGPYYTSGFDPVRLTCDTIYIRAWPGGTGGSKVGGNYAPTLKAQAEANSKGYSQVLWLFGENDDICEVGAMNIFFFLINKQTSRPELVTPHLKNGDILPGVTRDSILHLTKSWGEFDVSERSLTMLEVKEAAEEGRLIEAFGAGTAAVVTPISCIQYKGQDIEVPATGELTKRIFNEIIGIQYGKIKGPDGWSVKIDEDETTNEALAY